MRITKMTRYLTFAVFIPALVACNAGTPTPPPKAVPHPSEVAWEDRSLFRDGLIQEEQGILDQLPGATVYHIDFDIAGDLLSLQGHQEALYTNREDVPLDAVYFRTFPNTAGGALSVSNVQVDGEDATSSFEFQDSALRVSMPSPLQPQEQVVIALDFEVEMAEEMGGNHGLFGYYEDVLVLDQFHPIIPVYDDEGWNVQDPPPNADLSYNDVSFYIVRVTLPVELTVVASGNEIGREYVDDSQTMTFAAGPVRDFYLAAAKGLIKVSAAMGSTTVNSYSLPDGQQASTIALQVAVDALRSLSRRFGAYPYTEFDVVGTPMTALGMEYPGMTAISLRLYDLNATVSGLPAPALLQSVVAHEVAHQWFYNIVGSDQLDEPWVDEAVTQYATALYYRDIHGTGAEGSYARSWRGRWGSVDRAEIPIGLPAGEYAADEYGPIVYGRGPIFVASLEEELGQEVFADFMLDYCTTHWWGIATAETFRQMVEEHCQCDLTSQFEEWVYPLSEE